MAANPMPSGAAEAHVPVSRLLSGPHRLLGSVLLKTIRDQFPTILAWVVGLVAIITLYLSFYPSIRSDPSLTTLKSDALPAGVSTAFGLDADLSVGSAYLNATLFNLILPWLFIAYAVSNGTRMVAGDEDRGLLDVLLSLPVRRDRIVLDRFAALTILIAVLMVFAGAAVWLVGLAVDIGVPVVDIAAAVVATALLGLSVGTVGLAIGALTGRPSLATGGSLAFALASYLLDTIGEAVVSIDGLRRVSVFYAAYGNEPASSGFGWSGILALLGLTVVLTAVAVHGFARRDIRS